MTTGVTPTYPSVWRYSAVSALHNQLRGYAGQTSQRGNPYKVVLEEEKSNMTKNLHSLHVLEKNSSATLVCSAVLGWLARGSQTLRARWFGGFNYLFYLQNYLCCPLRIIIVGGCEK